MLNVLKCSLSFLLPSFINFTILICISCSTYRETVRMNLHYIYDKE